MQLVIIFAVVALLHFIVSVAGILFTLPVAFDVRGGLAPEPGKAMLVWLSSLLLAPLAWLSPLLPPGLGLGYGEIAIVSAMFGVGAVALAHACRLLLAKTRKPDVAA